MNIRSIRSTVPLLVVVGLAYGSVCAEKLKLPPFDLEADAAAQARDYVKTKKLEALGGVRKIAIPSFQVEFAVQNVASAWSSSTDGITSTKTKVRLSGPDRAVMQALTDRLYDKVVADLQAAGLEVVPFAVVRQNENFQKFQARQEPSPLMLGTTEFGKSMFFAPHDMPVYFRGDDLRACASTRSRSWARAASRSTPRTSSRGSPTTSVLHSSGCAWSSTSRARRPRVASSTADRR
jgi:hypothetical protein